ncbi:MAG: glutamine amidotransferase [Fibrobacterales bacterium]
MGQNYIIKAGSTFLKTQRTLGDFDCWIQRALGSCAEVTVVDIEAGDKLPAPEFCDRVIISGSQNRVTDNLPWHLELEQWITQAVELEVSILGIGLGHQLIARALGGSVGEHTQGIEVGTVEIAVDQTNAAQDPLFGGFSGSFTGHTSHRQSITRLPPHAVSLASSHFENNQAVRYAASVWGVQFHPEFTTEIIEEYIVQQRKDLINEWFDVGKLLSEVKESPEALGLIPAFLTLVQEKRMAS